MNMTHRIQKMEQVLMPCRQSGCPDFVQDEANLRDIHSDILLKEVPEELRDAHKRRCQRADLILWGKMKEEEVRSLNNQQLKEVWHNHPALVQRRVQMVLLAARVATDEKYQWFAKIAGKLIYQYEQNPDLGEYPPELKKLNKQYSL